MGTTTPLRQIDPGHPLLAGSAAGPDFTIVTGLEDLTARLSRPMITELLLDTETVGLPGIPFLLQLEDPESHAPIIVRVRDHTPAAVSALLRAVIRPGLRLVGHNLVFDLAKLTHLATIAALLDGRGLGWTEDTVWPAERIWRPGEASFEERLSAIRVCWPGACVDTLLAAKGLPPFANEFQQEPGISFRQLPVAVVPSLVERFRHNLNKDVGGVEARWRLGNHLHWRWDDNPTSGEKSRRAAAIQHRDYSVLGDVRISIRMPSPYSLKTLSPLLGYTGAVAKQDFESVFGRADEKCPVWTERGGPASKVCGHDDAWARSLELERDPGFLAYAAADIRMLRAVYDHYRAQQNFGALDHDMALVPWAAAVRMIGIHINEAARDGAKAAYAKLKAEGEEHCRSLGLTNINSPEQVVGYVNDHVIRTANNAITDNQEALEGVEDGRRRDTLEPLLKLLENRPDAHSAAGNLRMLIQARTFDRRHQFVESIQGDSLFPEFDIYGTQTDRMTCSNPNSQQTPSPDKETDWEKENDVHFRAMFSPPDGYEMRAGDFDQLELRVKSGVTNDPHTQGIYAREIEEQPADEHSETALAVFSEDLHRLLPGKTDAEILQLLRGKDKRVKHLRGRAKTANFGVTYGGTEYGISRNAGCSLEEARILLDRIWALCRVTKAVIDQVHERVTAIKGGPGGVEVLAPAQTAVWNKAGVARYFRVPLRLITIAGSVADGTVGTDGCTYLQRHFPELVAVPGLVRRGRDFVTGQPVDVTPARALQSALRGGAFNLQKAIHRRSFNFLIQSTGSYLTKRLQGCLYNELRGGVWLGNELPSLPGLQVHDEIHYYVKSAAPSTRADASAQRFLAEASAWVGCPIRFKFEDVGSWAEK